MSDTTTATKARNPDRLAAQVRAAIEQKGMTIHATARRAGACDWSVRRWLTGQGGTSIATLGRVCDVLELDLVQREHGEGQREGAA